MTTKDQMLYVPVEQLEPDPAQPRRDFDAEGEHKWLVESIRQHGVINPLTVRPGDDGKYTVVAGERRLKAAAEAGLSEVPVVLRQREGDDSRVVAIVENVVRADLNPIEEGDAYQALVGEGRDAGAVAELVNRPVSAVEDRLKLAAMPESARQALIDGVPLHPMRLLAAIAALDRPLADALAFGADHGAYNWDDLDRPSECLTRLANIDWGVKERKCKDCNGVGELKADGSKFRDEAEFEDSDDAFVTCETCGGQGKETVPDKKAPKPPLYFAVKVGRWGDGVGPTMLAQLSDDAQKRIEEDTTRAVAHYEDLRKKSGYAQKPPGLALHGDGVELAVKGTQGVAIDLGRATVVTSPEFVSEWLPDIWKADVDEYVTPQRPGAKVKAPKGDLTPEQQAQAEKESEARAAERKAALEARQNARQFNHDLGVALAQIGEVEVTTQVMRLLVSTIVEETRPHDYSGRRGEGHALWQRFTSDEWPTRKNGDPILPRKADERKAYVEEVDARFDRQLKAAKTPGQALAVLVRYLGHGLADLEGLPNADLEGASPYQAAGWRGFVKKLLPVGVRKRVRDDNGVPGRSYNWR